MRYHSAFILMFITSFSGCGNKPHQPPTTSAIPEAVTDHPANTSPSMGQSPVTDSSENRGQIASHSDDNLQEYVSFPAAGVKLIRPAGFDDAQNFHGFQQPATQSSVMAVLVPISYAETTRGFSANHLQAAGMTLLTKEVIEVDGIPGVILGVTQSAYGMEFAKWIVAFGNETETRLVTATFPRSEEAHLSDTLKAVVYKVRMDNVPVPSPGSDVGFSIQNSGKLKLTRGIGKMLMFTMDGTISAESRENPLFVAAPSLGAHTIDDKRQFAEQRIMQTAHTKIRVIHSNDEINIDGLDGYEIIADAVDADSGTALKVYQVLLYDEASYILMQGLVGEKMADQYLPEFQKMARSLTRNPK